MPRLAAAPEGVLSVWAETWRLTGVRSPIISIALDELVEARKLGARGPELEGGRMEPSSW